MRTLKELIGDSTYMVTDSQTNSYNFHGLVEVDEFLVYIAGNTIEWDLTEDLPEHVMRAIDTMVENDVSLEEYTGIISFEDSDSSYYLLTW